MYDNTIGYPPWIPPHDCVPRTVRCPSCGKLLPYIDGADTGTYEWIPYSVDITYTTDGNDVTRCNHAGA